MNEFEVFFPLVGLSIGITVAATNAVLWVWPQLKPYGKLIATAIIFIACIFQAFDEGLINTATDVVLLILAILAAGVGSFATNGGLLAQFKSIEPAAFGERRKRHALNKW